MSTFMYKLVLICEKEMGLQNEGTSPLNSKVKTLHYMLQVLIFSGDKHHPRTQWCLTSYTTYG